MGAFGELNEHIDINCSSNLQYFYYRCNIDIEMTVRSLAALAHPVRIGVFRHLVKAAPEGVSAGDLALALGVPANTLSFHLKELSHALIVSSERRGRSILYSIQLKQVNELMQFLYEDCCQGKPELCQPSDPCYVESSEILS